MPIPPGAALEILLWQHMHGGLTCSQCGQFSYDWSAHDVRTVAQPFSVGRVEFGVRCPTCGHVAWFDAATERVRIRQ